MDSQKAICPTSPTAATHHSRPNRPAAKIPTGKTQDPTASTQAMTETVRSRVCGGTDDTKTDCPACRTQIGRCARVSLRHLRMPTDVLRSSGGDAGSGDCFDVSRVGTTTAAEHVEVRMRSEESGVERPEFDRVAVVELLGCVEFGVAGA